MILAALLSTGLPAERLPAHPQTVEQKNLQPLDTRLSPMSWVQLIAHVPGTDAAEGGGGSVRLSSLIAREFFEFRAVYPRLNPRGSRESALPPIADVEADIFDRQLSATSRHSIESIGMSALGHKAAPRACRHLW
jgi:hypothetical protein